MQLGWIDFSKSERNKVLNVLDMLSEAGTLDELGIAPIRDGFANRFFPGTSTIQTRAKYFLCVPYAFKEIERSGETSPNRMFKALSAIEKSCGEYFVARDPKADGIIGRRALSLGNWVKRAPTDLYWAGLRRLGIFVGGELSVAEYIRFMCANNNQKGTLKNLGNRNDSADENECDDNDAGKSLYKRFWNIPTYTRNWQEGLTLELTSAEAEFLKDQVIKTCGGTMFAYILQNSFTDITELNGIEELEHGFIEQFPESVQEDYTVARAFSDFVYVMRVLFNIIVSDGQNTEANDEWKLIEPNLEEYANINIDDIFERLSLAGHAALRHFLKQAQEYMRTRDIEALKECIIKREVHLKGVNRAKTKHPGEFDSTVWFGGKQLDYRFNNAKIIIKDIFEGVNNHAESE